MSGQIRRERGEGREWILHQTVSAHGRNVGRAVRCCRHIGRDVQARQWGCVGAAALNRSQSPLAAEVGGVLTLPHCLFMLNCIAD